MSATTYAVTLTTANARQHLIIVVPCDLSWAIREAREALEKFEHLGGSKVVCAKVTNQKSGHVRRYARDEEPYRGPGARMEDEAAADADGPATITITPAAVELAHSFTSPCGSCGCGPCACEDFDFGLEEPPVKPQGCNAHGVPHTALAAHWEARQQWQREDNARRAAEDKANWEADAPRRQAKWEARKKELGLA